MSICQMAHVIIGFTLIQIKTFRPNKKRSLPYYITYVGKQNSFRRFQVFSS